MNKAPKDPTPVEEDDLLPEYRLDYSQARPNRFLERLAPGGIAVLLDPDVAAVFRTSEAVNEALRSLMDSKAEKAGPSSAKKRKAS